MEVYIEDAFMINFLLDGLLLLLALKAAREKVRPFFFSLACVVGAGEAVLFPLFDGNLFLSYLLKILGGVILPLIASPRGRLAAKGKVIGFFFLFTFLLGGILTALYRFFSVPYQTGKGYLVESAPIGLVFAVASIFLILSLKGIRALYRYRAVQKKLFSCKVRAGDRELSLKGLADSGNLLSFRGKPVCVLSPVCALAIFRFSEPLGRMKISSVNGSKESPVFEGEMKIGTVQSNCYFTVGEISSKDYQMILHIDLTEGA